MGSGRISSAVVRAAVVGLAAGTAIACGSTPSPSGPPGPSGQPLQLTCASDISASILGSSQGITYASPTVTGGTPPVAAVCSPASGSQFSLGQTKVSCVATDGAAKTATCSLAVNLTAITIGVKRFQTVGDSLTEGENGLDFRIAFVDSSNSYPTKLGALFDASFPGQGVTVSNRGHGGDSIETTLSGLPSVLASDQPEAVLLLSGYNNLTGTCPRGVTVEVPACDAAVESLEDKLREAIQLIKRTASVRYVLVATLTPPGPVAPNAAHDRRIDESAIADISNRIRAMAPAEGAVVVDLFTAFGGHESEYTSTDGLHLRPAGYQAIADQFFAKILATVPQSSASAIK